ncbi:hypothetical protein HD554DRAFT_2207366 [Boletus coccyginus]|nr:hypothetical protein HD554DRAFT_2207366 [Boletus coccyginus]
MSPAGCFPLYLYHLKSYICSFPDCHKSCRIKGGLKCHAQLHQQRGHQHVQLLQQHADLTNCEGSSPGDPGKPNPDKPVIDTNPYHRHTRDHPLLNSTSLSTLCRFFSDQPNQTETPCNPFGDDLPPSVPPFPSDYCARGNHWTPYASCKIDTLMDIWSMMYNGHDPPFRSHDALYKSIDAIPYGDCPWQSFSVRYSGQLPENSPSWMVANYDVWYHDPLRILEQQIGNLEFVGEIDYGAKVVTDENGQHKVCDLMSGQWVWDQLELIAQDLDTRGATFAPIVLGSDKTTVSVGTGNTEYYLLYISLGNVHNNVRHSHSGVVTILAFLAIPKTDSAHKDNADFHHFRRQLFHSSLAAVLNPVKQAMVKPRVTRCTNGHFRHIIYGLGPYIANYPEQACLHVSCTAQNSDLDRDGGSLTMDLRVLWDDYGIVGDVEPFTAHFPRVDIHELITPDLLHQLIKGMFKDHLVSWVNNYLKHTYPKQQAMEIIAKIDRRIAAVPPFPGLRQFPEGRGFKQWMGDDSKALMKVYLPAITGLVPDQMVHTITSFLDFCYIMWKSVINETDLDAIDDAVQCFHFKQEIFKEVSVRDHFSLPHQHAMVHYRMLIKMFGVPNGLCSLITEFQHIKVVKEPWCCSNRFEALGQIAHNIAAVPPLDEDEEDEPQAIEGDKSIYNVQLARKLHVAACYGIPELAECTWCFLYDQQNPNAKVPGDRVDLQDCPSLNGNVKVFTSDIVHCTPWWWGEDDPLSSLLVARVLLFFSFRQDGRSYSCALVEWFLPISDEPDELTGMWIVVPEVNTARQHVRAVISVNTIL